MISSESWHLHDKTIAIGTMHKAKIPTQYILEHKNIVISRIHFLKQENSSRQGSYS